jgi:hypothetical protein
MKGTDATVALMAKMAMGIYGARSTKIRALAINILTAARVPEKNYTAEMVAIHNWVRDNIRYTRDVAGQETLLHPEELAFNSKAGDCDDKSMLEVALLGAVGITTRFITIGLTPYNYSHVYLEANPTGNQWIPLDPIMKGKPAGWEAPASRVKLRKAYPINASEEVHMNGHNLNGVRGMAGLRGLGYVGDPRVVSFLEEEPAPERNNDPYVVMDSFLDQDAPIEQISRNAPAFPQQDVSRMRPAVAHQLRPKLGRIGADEAARRSAIDDLNYNDTESAAFNPMDGLSGPYGILHPDQLAEMGDVMAQQQVRPNMQRPVLAQTPEGVDMLFTRPNMIARFDKSDHVVFRGMYALNEKPPIRRVGNFAGLSGVFGVRQAPRHQGMMPARSLSGPGMAELADLGDDVVPAPVQVAAPASKLPLLALALAGVGLYLLSQKKK